MAYARRVDGPHRAVRDTLRELGYTVTDTSRVGGGFPDLLVWSRRWDTVAAVEVKAGTGKLRQAQERWRDAWPGRYVVLRPADEAIQWWRQEAA